uniref:Uncharacterized protein n=1 Tax=Vertebrata australis TaxID=1967852 RepID=A0A1Z1MHZ6_9FLOR|nr:hypothetical protein [Vertebrata australis]ARW65698.1 hypothetical protein [Vertebrata australis]
MYSYNFLFYLYLIIVLLVLCTFSFFVSLQLKVFALYLLKSINLIYFFKKKILFVEEDYLYFFALDLMRLDYSKCIALSELFLENNHLIQNKMMLYRSLGFVYSKISFFTLAEYYYLEALSYSPNNIDLILSLVQIYHSLNYKEKVKLWLNKILILDPSFAIPLQFID